MQRLRGVKQLGTAYLAYPGAMHTRFDHSIGTLHMARRMIEAIRLKRLPTRIVPPDAFWRTDEVRARFARLIHVADATRIAIQPGVSYGVATAARNLPIASGDNVVITHEQFPGNYYSWERLASEHGAQLRVACPPDGADRGRRWNDRLLESIDARTRLATWSSPASLLSSARASHSLVENKQLRTWPSAVNRSRLHDSQNGWETESMKPTLPTPSAKA